MLRLNVNSEVGSVASTRLKRYISPRTVIMRFIARHVAWGALLWGVIFAAFTASKGIGYVKAYATPAARQAFAASFGNNIGIKVLLGSSNHIETVTGYIAWNMSSPLIMIGVIWALLVSTKYFRGEEEAGRSELLLTGQTSARGAAANILGGLGVGAVCMYLAMAAGFSLVGRYQGIQYGATAACFFALTIILCVALFLAIGACMSQIMPTRGRAATTTAGIFGLFLIIRAMADVTSARWLLDITPLGWAERMQPLYQSQWQWMLPMIGLIVVLSIVTVVLAGKRDVGGSLFADHDERKARTWLLNGPFTIAMRLTSAASIAWLVSALVTGILYGLLTKSAAQAFASSARYEHLVGKLTHAAQITGANSYMGIVFFLVMLLVMGYAASAVGAIRRDEAEGYTDNLFVRKVGRLQWLCDRTILAAIIVLLAGVVGALGAWIGEASQHAGLSFHSLLLAGVNASAPGLLVLAIGILTFGWLPRIASFMACGVIAWSFLIEIISSGITINHWLLDTSPLHHITLAPAVDPNWRAVYTFVGIGFVLCLIGALRFKRRDLAGD